MCVRVCVDSVYADDAEEAVKQVQILLEENSVDVAVRIGDLCGFLIEHFARKQKWQAVRRPSKARVTSEATPCLLLHSIVSCH